MLRSNNFPTIINQSLCKYSGDGVKTRHITSILTTVTKVAGIVRLPFDRNFCFLPGTATYTHSSHYFNNQLTLTLEAVCILPEVWRVSVVLHLPIRSHQGCINEQKYTLYHYHHCSIKHVMVKLTTQIIYM